MTKHRIRPLRPVKTRISLHTCSLIRVFADHMCLLQPPGYPKTDKQEPLPYCVDVQADLSLCCSHRSYCRFCPMLAHSSLLKHIWGTHDPHLKCLNLWYFAAMIFCSSAAIWGCVVWFVSLLFIDRFLILIIVFFFISDSKSSLRTSKPCVTLVKDYCT